MSAYDQLERQLLTSIEQRASARRRPRGPRIRWLLPALSTGVVVAVAVFAVVVLGHRRPAPARVSAAPPNPALLNEAYVATMRRDPACRVLAPQFFGPPTVSYGTPSATMLSVLGEMRRPATAADSPQGRQLNEMLPPRAEGVYVRYIRLARVVDGVRYYIIPAARVGEPALAPAVAGRCAREQRTALAGELRGLAPSARQAALTADLQRLRGTWRAREQATWHEGVFELEVSASGASGGGGASPQQIAARGVLGSDGPVLEGVIPSGVATVILRWPGRGHSSPLAVRASVVDNLFVARVPRANGGDFPKTMVWLNTRGHVIKTVAAP